MDGPDERTPSEARGGASVFVFISYRRRSSSFAAQALRYALRQVGHDAFVDTGSISDGDAYCWRNNASGQVGNGSTGSVDVPTRVAG